MKDKEARERITELEEQVNRKLRNLVFKYCPKCKRSTIVDEMGRYNNMGDYRSYYECLICGTEFEIIIKSNSVVIK